MKKLKFILSIGLGALIFSHCSSGNKDKRNSQPVPIASSKSYSLSSVGGMMGHSQSITITEDSVAVSLIIAANQFQKDTVYATPDNIWAELTTLTNLEDLKSVKNGASVQPVDGLDDILEVKTERETINIVNGRADNENYKKIEPLVNKLQSIIPRNFQSR